MATPVDQIGSGRQADGARQSRRYGTKAVALTGLAGIALGGLVGSLVTRGLAAEPPPSRVFVAAGVPEKSVGDMVFPVSVINAGHEPLSVLGLHLARNDMVGTPLELVSGGSPTVPANEGAEFLVRAPATCPPELQGQSGGVQLSVVVRVGDGVDRPVFHRVAGAVSGTMFAVANC